MSDMISSLSRSVALTNRFLTTAHVERMLSAPDAKESFRILYDMNWAQNMGESEVSDFENVLQNGLFEMKSTFADEENPLTTFLLLPFDLQNAKVSLAGFSKKKTFEDLLPSLSGLSFFPKKTAFSVLEMKKADNSFFQQAVLKAGEIIFEDASHILRAEEHLDVACLKEMARLLFALKNPALRDMFQKQLHIENIKNAVRRPQSDVLFLSFCGRFSAEKYSPKKAEKYLSSSEAFQKGKEIYNQKGDLSNWELEMELVLLEKFFWTARTNPLGVENIALFFWTKLRNAEIIRSILVGKRNGFSTVAIRKMVAPFLLFLPQT